MLTMRSADRSCKLTRFILFSLQRIVKAASFGMLSKIALMSLTASSTSGVGTSYTK